MHFCTIGEISREEAFTRSLSLLDADTSRNTPRRPRQDIERVRNCRIYHNNCGAAFRDQRDKEKLTNEMLPVYGEATLANAYLQIDDKRKEYGAEKFCSDMKPAVEAFTGRERKVV